MKNEYTILEESIFVYMTSMNDPYLEQTVNDLYEKAYSPENIYLCIFNQRSDGVFCNFKNKNIINIKVHYENPVGVGLGRLFASHMNPGFKYVMSVDAHTLFSLHWDKYLIEDYKKIKSKVDKPIISGYNGSWRPSQGAIRYSHSINLEEQENIFGGKVNNMPLVYVKKNKEDLGGIGIPEDHETHEFIYRTRIEKDVVEHYLITCNFIFSESSFLLECDIDPSIRYWGEEPSLSLIACTRGWRIFSPMRFYSFHLEDEIGISVSDKNSWRNIYSNFSARDKDNKPYPPMIGKLNWLRRWEYLEGNAFGSWGAPNGEEYEKYVKNITVNPKTRELTGSKGYIVHNDFFNN